MALFGLFNKKKIPEELPDLATDEIEKKIDINLEKDQEEISNHLIEESNSKNKEKKDLGKREVIKSVEETLEDESLSREVSEVEQRSFFNDLQKNLDKELGNLDKLESWYDKKFLTQDIVSDMRNYWENQKTNSVLQILGKNFKERINLKTTKLQELEREWQNIYFDLIEKEEEIKDEEKELKKLLAELVEICKKKKMVLGDKNDNGQKKERKQKKKI